MNHRLLSTFTFLALLMLPLLPAQELDSDNFWQYTAEQVEVQVHIESGVQLSLQKSSGSIDYVQADVLFSPQDYYSQDVISLKTQPDPVSTTGKFAFFWDNPEPGDLDFSIDARVISHPHYLPITRKIAYPLASLPSDVLPYTKPSEHINSDDEKIIRLASQLVQGKNDLYDVVYTIASWTNKNIEYNLSTLTAEVSQPASWVLENRQGVCDELTSLFIAQLRTLGIPAKFISGVVYSDSELFENDWGAHGWAEVYFPSVGWVAWDVTYGEYGFVDPTHIKLKESIDSAQSATVFTWLGRDVVGVAKPIIIDAQLIDYKGVQRDKIALDLDVYDHSIGFGSANLIQVHVTNLLDSYISPTVILTPVNTIEYVEDSTQTLFLAPFETKTVSWVVEAPQNLDEHFVYTIPVEVKSSQGGYAKDSFVISKGESILDVADLQTLAHVQENNQEESAVDVQCSSIQQHYYAQDNVVYECRLKNRGTSILDDLLVCLEDVCKRVDLFLNQESVVEFNLGTFEEGFHQLPLSLKHRTLDQLYLIELQILDKPSARILIDNLSSTIHYEESEILQFIVEPTSQSGLHNTTVRVELGRSSEEFVLGDVDSKQVVQLGFRGDLLNVGRNTGTITLVYEDYKGNSYSSKETFSISLVDVTLWQRMEIWLKELFK